MDVLKFMVLIFLNEFILTAGKRSKELNGGQRNSCEDTLSKICGQKTSS